MAETMGIIRRDSRMHGEEINAISHCQKTVGNK